MSKGALPPSCKKGGAGSISRSFETTIQAFHRRVGGGVQMCPELLEPLSVRWPRATAGLHTRDGR